jgi:hypothetical protein
MGIDVSVSGPSRGLALTEPHVKAVPYDEADQSGSRACCSSFLPGSHGSKSHLRENFKFVSSQFSYRDTCETFGREFNALFAHETSNLLDITGNVALKPQKM